MSKDDQYKIVVYVIEASNLTEEVDAVVQVKVGNKERRTHSKKSQNPRFLNTLKFYTTAVAMTLSLIRNDNGLVIGEAQIQLPNPTFNEPTINLMSAQYKFQQSLKKPGTETIIGQIRFDVTKRQRQEKDKKKIKKEKKRMGN